MEKENEFQRESEMIRLAYQENITKFKKAGYKGVVKKQMFDKIVQEYLNQNMDLARRKIKYKREIGDGRKNS